MIESGFEPRLSASAAYLVPCSIASHIRAMCKIPVQTEPSPPVRVQRPPLHAPAHWDNIWIPHSVPLFSCRAEGLSSLGQTTSASQRGVEGQETKKVVLPGSQAGRTRHLTPTPCHFFGFLNNKHLLSHIVSEGQGSESGLTVCFGVRSLLRVYNGL